MMLGGCMAKISINIDNDLNITKELNGTLTKIIIETDKETYEFANNSKKKISKKDLRAIYNTLDK